jgi:hypothetical protein
MIKQAQERKALHGAEEGTYHDNLMPVLAIRRQVEAEVQKRAEG